MPRCPREVGSLCHYQTHLHETGIGPPITRVQTEGGSFLRGGGATQAITFRLGLLGLSLQADTSSGLTLLCEQRI